MIEDRQPPPTSIESEIAVLCSILSDNACLDTVHTLLSAQDFYRESHRQIFTVMTELRDNNEPIDLITLVQALKKAGKLEESGGGAYLASIGDYDAYSFNVAHYCKIVAEMSQRRTILTTVKESAAMIYDHPIEDVLAMLSACTDLQSKGVSGPVGVKQALTESIRIIEQRYEAKGEIQGIPYGIEELDKVTDGMHRGDLIIIAGRPSMGKSALAGNIAATVCKSGLSPLVFNLEMSRSQIIDRALSDKGNLNHSTIRNGWLKENDWPKLLKAASTMHEWNLFIDDTPGIGLREIRAKAKKQKRDGLDLIEVDYLQLMRVDPKANRTQAIGEISRGLKQLARELDVPVILLSQLNRGVDSRPDKRPIMSDLRDSGEIEQDADVILFPYRPAAYCAKCKDRIDDSDHGYHDHQMKAEIIVEKQRNGERNISIPVNWEGQYLRFSNQNTGPFY
jgi:replicative DNA helicase